MRAIEWQAYAQVSTSATPGLSTCPSTVSAFGRSTRPAYRLTCEETSTPYRLNVGDEVQVESFTDHEINRNLLIQPDMTIHVAIVGPGACDRPQAETQLRDVVEEAYKKYYKTPAITVTPLASSTRWKMRATTPAGLASAAKARRFASRPRVRSRCPPSARSRAGLTLSELQTELKMSPIARLFTASKPSDLA